MNPFSDSHASSRSARLAAVFSSVVPGSTLAWSDVFAFFSDGTLHARSAVEPFVLAADGETVGLAVFCGDYPPDTSDVRRFEVTGESGSFRFYTSGDGSSIWCDFDVDGWVVSHRGNSADVVRLTPRGAMLSGNEYAELHAAVSDDAFFSVRPLWSTTRVCDVLSVWARAFFDVDVRFEFSDDLGARPAFYEEAFRRAEELARGDVDLVSLCMVEVLHEGALPGESGRRHLSAVASFVNPDGTPACDEHAVDGAAPISD